MSRIGRTFLVFVLFLFPVLLGLFRLGPQEAQAFSTGATGLSGNPGAGGGDYCVLCHSGGIVPNVVIAGPAVVDAGTTNSYTLTIVGGQQAGGGLDVSVTGGALIQTDAGTQLAVGEITHTMPRMADMFGRVTFLFDWQAPTAPGVYTIYGAGNSVNLNMNFQGDNAALANLDVVVNAAAGQTPGESSGEMLAMLEVSNYDGATGDISISFESPCEAVDNNIYYGALADVSTYGWSGESCGVGTGGTASFNPGPGSFFFVVVGIDGIDEGSYGKATGDTERPPFAGNLCGAVQTLVDACDLP